MKRQKLLAISSLVIILVIAISTISAASAAIITKNIDGKGAIAQFSVAGSGGAHKINAVVSMSNAGKDAQIYISITHPLKGTSEASGPANIKWSMNHVSAEAILVFTGPVGRTGTHKITVNWATDGLASNGALSANTGKGLAAEIDGTWKIGVAELSISDSSGHHQYSEYTSNWAVIVHGTADIALS